MDEEQLRVFVGLVQQYFEHQTGRPADVGSPHLGEPTALPMYDFTGVIGISGSRPGCVYFTAHRDLLRQLLLHVAPEVGPLLIKPEAMRRCLNNILQNAARHAMRIEVSLSRQGQAQIIEIRDNGPGIPAAMRETVFRPFFRLETARTPRALVGDESGVGLGMTIARDIVRGHGGDIALSDNVPHGLVVTIKLPL